MNWIESTNLAIDGGLSIRLRGGREIELSRRRFEELRAKLSL